MRKLFLASSFDDVASLLPSFLNENVSGKTVTFIPTASLYEAVNFYVDSAKDAFEELGLIVDMLDISTAPQDVIKNKLSKNDYIYLSGGNTFFLLQELIKSGADKVIIELVNAGKPYIGESAGAIVAVPNIDYAKGMDDSSIATDLQLYDALHLVDIYPVPHYTNYPFEEAADAIIDEWEETLDLRPITNDQVILVTGELVGILAKHSYRVE